MAQMKVRMVKFLSKIKYFLLEQTKLISKLQAEGLIKKIPKLENCWLAKTDPKDVARVESKTVICTESENETIPTPADGVEGKYLLENVPFQGYLMVSGCDSLASLEDSRKWGCVRLMLNLLILALPRGINFPLDLSEYSQNMV